MRATITIEDKPGMNGDVSVALQFDREGKTIAELESSPAILIAVRALEWITEQRDDNTDVRNLRISGGGAE